MKKKILLLPDVRNWAWGIKSRYIKKYLDNEFDVDIHYISEKTLNKNNDIYDLYLTYTPVHLSSLRHVDRDRKLTGLTGMPCFDVHFHHKDKKPIDFNNIVAGVHANCLQFRNLVKKSHKKTYYVPNGVDSEFFKKQDFVDNKNVLFVGFVGKNTPIKGLGNIIRPAVAKAGAGSKVKLISNINNWKSAKSHISLVDFYKKIDVQIVASTQEGTPNPALEAAACGRPVLSNRVGNMEELIEDGIHGFLVERNVNAYAEKLKYLLQHKDQMREMGNNIREKIVKDWDWSIKAENYRNMFRSVLGIE